jgi:hypothetical protein
VTQPPGLRAHLTLLGALAAVAAIVAVAWLTSESRRYAATNSTAPRGWTTSVEPGHTLCVNQLWMPAGSDAVRMRLGTLGRGPTRAALSLTTPEGPRRATVPVTTVRGQDIDFPVAPLRRSASVGLCLRATRTLGGVSGTPYVIDDVTGRPASTLDGQPIPHRISVWFLEPRERTLASTLPDASRRAALFRAGFVGQWTYVVLTALLPLLWFFGLRAVIGGRR